MFSCFHLLILCIPPVWIIINKHIMWSKNLWSIILLEDDNICLLFHAFPFKLVPLWLYTVSTVLGNISKFLCFELSICGLWLFFNCDDVIQSSSLQCQLELWGKKKVAGCQIWGVCRLWNDSRAIFGQKFRHFRLEWTSLARSTLCYL